MSIDPGAVVHFVGAINPVAAGLALVLSLIVLVVLWRAGRGIARALHRALTGKRPEDVITFGVAATATAVSAQGMLKFLGDKMQMPVALQVMSFSMFEMGMLACALRGRRKIRDPQIGTAGIDGALVWVLAGVSALLSSTDAHGWGVLARLIVPFFAAGSWELLLAFERRRTGRRTINWRISPERILVRLGLAEATGRTAGDVDMHRRITRVALAAHRLRLLTAAGARGWRLRQASRRLNGAVRAAVEYADLASNKARQDELMAQLAVLNGAVSLAEVSPLAPWNRPDPQAVLFDGARVRFAPLIAGAIGTDTAPARPDTGTEQAANLPLDTGADNPRVPPADTGTDSAPERPKNTGTRRGRRGRRRTGTKTGPKARTAEEKAALLARARELNTEHMREHGRPISGDKLATALHVSKTTALDLLKEIKRLREVPPVGGVA